MARIIGFRESVIFRIEFVSSLFLAVSMPKIFEYFVAIPI